MHRSGLRWRPAHYTWLRQLTRTTSPLAPEDHLVCGEYFARLEYKLSRREVLDRHIAELALTPAVAMVLATELVDWRRFASPRQLRAYLGFVPREPSTGPRERRGSIPKAGHAHRRHVLVQAAWTYRLHPQVGPAPLLRQRGQPPTATRHAWKAQQQLYAMYHRLSLPRGPQIAVVAIARELLGNLWAVIREPEAASTASSPTTA